MLMMLRKDSETHAGKRKAFSEIINNAAEWEI